MKVLLTGGGTMGPVTPLLAIVEAWRAHDPNVEFFWIGTPRGPERSVVSAYGVRFVSLPVVRLTRHASIEWFLLPFKIVSAFVRAFVIVVRFRPDVIGSAGGYTSVPVVMAGSVLGVPSWVHQMDARPILTTRLIAPFASRITVSFQQTLKSFPLVKTRVVGNPVRASLYEGSRNHAIELFGLNPKLRTVLVVGGGTGAKWLNEAILSQVKKICARANVIHLTGRGKSMAVAPIVNYHQIEFLDSDMKHALACADVVVSRAGMGSITELCALSKPSILVPLPKSAQQQNARALGSAVEVIEQEQGPVVLRKKILELLDDPERRVELSQQIVRALRTDCAQELVFMLEEIAK